MTRRFLPVALALAAAIPLAPARAQISPGLHFARAADSFDGVNGVGGNLELRLRGFPVDLFLAGEYFFPDCDDCSSWGGSADVHVTLARAVLSPYGTAGFVLRNREVSDTEVSTGGLGLGGGVNLATPGLGAFAEVRFEILDGMGDLFVFRLGLRL
jgi:hypothetical protein